MNKAFKIRLYPNNSQKELIDKTIGCTRFIYNQMLAERKDIYENLKENKEKLYKYKYKTEKDYKKEFEFLKDVSSRALQQSRLDLSIAYSNFFKGLKKKRKVGFPKFKSKKKAKLTYREPQTGKSIEIKGSKLKLMKTSWINFKGLSKGFNSETMLIKSATIEKTKSNKYFATILVEYEKEETKEVTKNNVLGVDLGLKEFAVCSNGEVIYGIKDEIKNINKKIDKQNRCLSRKNYGSKNYEKCRIKLNRLYEYRTNFLNHFQWALINKLCSENKTIVIENLAIKNMIKNRKLSKAIHSVNWSSFVSKLKQKAIEMNSTIHVVSRFFPSSKICSACGKIKKDLQLSDRVYKCECGNEIDRDLNAAINLRKLFLLENNLSLEYNDYSCGERVRPIDIAYNTKGTFDEAIKNEVNECNIC